MCYIIGRPAIQKINLILYPLENLNYFTAVYTAPRQPQITRFSKKRFKEALSTSRERWLENRLVLPSSITHKEFQCDGNANNHLWMYSAWGEAESLLGIEGDLVCIDVIK